MSKADIQKKCDDLGIKYQENDTVEQLELMIKGVELEKQIEELEASLLADLEAEKKRNAELLEVNQELQQALEEAGKSAPSADVTFKVGSKKFRFVGKSFSLKGQTYTAKEAAQNKAVLEKLVQMKSGIIEPIK